MESGKLEIACFNLESAIIAQENGADRIELCENRNEGGITPSVELVKTVRNAITSELFAMIRPRSGDFVYSESELEQMKISIATFKKFKVDGFVFGILNVDGSLNELQNRKFVALAHPLPCTFHRAFDGIQNKFESLEILIDCGFKTILTSGGGATLMEGIDVLATLIQKAKGRIVIMPGGGLRSRKIELVKQKTKAMYYHSSAITNSGSLASPIEIQALKAILQVMM